MYKQRFSIEAYGLTCIERNSIKVIRDTEKISKCRYMKERIGYTYIGKVSGVNKDGFYVTLNENGIEGFVKYDVPNLVTYDEIRIKLFDLKNCISLRIKDTVKVRVKNVNTKDKVIELSLVS